MMSLVRWSAILAVGVVAIPADGRTPDDIAGRVVGQVEGRTIELPMVKSDYDVQIAGDVATVTVKQRFVNPGTRPMSAEYLFPLNKGSAVFAMEMQVGDETIIAQIQKKSQAEATFLKAEQEGKAASLLTQHRPNMFTQRIANLMPGLPVSVTLSYVQSVPKIDGAHELVVPLIVGPRYKGAPPTPHVAARPQTVDALDPQPVSAPTAPGGWHIEPVPDYPPTEGVDLPPGQISPDRVALSVSIAGGGLPVSDVTSTTHAISLADTEDATVATLSAGRVIGNRDFVLRYRLGGDALGAGVLSHYDARGGFVSLMLTPPEVPDVRQATPRELVFVLDTSGSMNGAPIRASRRFMDAALAALRPEDHFRIISFSNAAAHMATSALPATPANIRAGRAHVSRLQAGGGTEIDRAIRSAFDTAQPAGALRIVVFLSDGYIGDEATVLRTIRQRIGDARIYAFGVGTSVNRYLLDAMAEEGRGYARYVDPTQTASEAAETLARDLRTPLLTDVSIDWGDLEVADASPARLPDLFGGNTLRVFARYRQGGRHEIRVNGLVQGRTASLPVQLDLPSAPFEDQAQTAALPLVWARRKIADLDRAFAVQDGDPDQIVDDITALGLKYALQTRYTSFVAVSERVVNQTGQPARNLPVAQPMVAGVETSAYPNGGFAGSSTPEPESLFGLIILSALGGFMAWRRRRYPA